MQEDDAVRVRHEQRAFFTRLAAFNGPTPGPADLQDAAYVPLLSIGRIRPGERIVDLACGAGRPTFALASLVGPQGFVLGLDLTPAVVEAAQAQARELGLHTVSFAVITSEVDLPVAPACVDVATCAYGLMYMPAPVLALRALHRALRPGGRVVVSTLAAPGADSCLAILSTILARFTGRSLVDLTAPGPFALGTEERLLQSLEAAGFAAVHTMAVPEAPEIVEDATTYWQRMATEGPTALMLASLPEDVVAVIRGETLTALVPLFRRGVVDLAGHALFAIGTKPH